MLKIGGTLTNASSIDIGNSGIAQATTMPVPATLVGAAAATSSEASAEADEAGVDEGAPAQVAVLDRGIWRIYPSHNGTGPVMVVNLNKYRKKCDRAESERRAAENRLRFGRSKAARASELRDREQAKKSLDDKRLH
jgi:Domain of unknown function (DUF4169)